MYTHIYIYIGFNLSPVVSIAHRRTHNANPFCDRVDPNCSLLIRHHLLRVCRRHSGLCPLLPLLDCHRLQSTTQPRLGMWCLRHAGARDNTRNHARAPACRRHPSG